MSPFSILETQHRISSIFVAIGLRVYGTTAHSIQHIAELGQFLGLHQSQILMIY